MTVIRFFAAAVVLLVSLYGVFINVLVYIGFSRRAKFNTSFYVFCRSRTITNVITCLAFLIWAGPCTFLNDYYLPHWANVFWGQIAGCGAYSCGLLVDCSVAWNRFFATYFPLNFRNHNKKPTYIILFLCWTIGAFVFAIGLRPSCGYIYNVYLLSWLPEDTPCSQQFSDHFFIVVCTVTMVTVVLNCFTFMKIFVITGNARKTSKACSTANKIKVRKSQRLFVQSLIQASFYLIDMLFCQLIYKLNDALWFRFICMGFVWLLIHVLDGTVMFVYNKDMLKRPVNVIKSRAKSTDSNKF